MKKEKKLTFTNIIAAISLTLLFVSSAVVFTLNFRPLYYADIENYGLTERTGIPEAEIKENYDALIDYNSMFYNGELEFPTLAMSESGRIHFEEVKAIFVAIQIMAIVSLGLSLAFVVIKIRKKNFVFLKLTAIFAVVLPLIVGAAVAIAWDSFFVIFHKIFFRNDYWIFDAVSDPVITILPDGFFMHCAILIVAIVIILAVLSFILYRVFSRRKMS